MAPQEGVVKYQLDYTKTAIDPTWVEALNAWRRVIFLLGGIGCDPARYGGYGYGNISCRLPEDAGAFVITGTQTGHLPFLTPEHYVVVRDCDPEQNRLRATGPIKPSAESLTHATVYAQDTGVQAVLHVHCPEVWNATQPLGVRATAPAVAYGTPEMARATLDLLKTPHVRQQGIFAMGGHEDGVVTFGETLAETGQRFIQHFARALAMESPV